MKKPNWKYGTWKNWKTLGFQFYFTLLVVVVIAGALAVGGLISDLITEWWGRQIEIPDLLLIIGFSLIVGTILSFFVGKILLVPIRKLEEAMNQVAGGDLDVTVQEKAAFDEIENMYHSFNIMMKELRSTKIIQNDFVSNVSHEFKTPLNAIEGYATLLEDKNLTEDEREEYTQKILFSTKKMSELVGNVLLISKIENQVIETKKTRFKLDEQIRQSILLFEQKWTEKQIEFDVDLDEVVYVGNEGFMLQVWNNLIGNAVKFSPYGGTITVTLKREGKIIIFSVQDQGQGIKEEQKKYIFDKFYQADSSRKQEGNGLGLALVKNILDVCGGEIFVENVEPKGCKFTVKIAEIA